MFTKKIRPLIILIATISLCLANEFENNDKPLIKIVEELMIKNNELEIKIAKLEGGQEWLAHVEDNFEERLAHVEELSKVKVLRTCEELARHGVTQSGLYYIDPDGELIGHDPIEVNCLFDNGKTITEIKHYFEKVIEVEMCEDIACFTHKIEYGIPMEQIEALSTLSEQCEQSIAFGCFLAPLLLDKDELGGWLDRYGNIII